MLHWWTLRKWTLTEDVAGVDIAGVDIDADTYHLVDTSSRTCRHKGGPLQLSSLGYFRTTVTTAAVSVTDLFMKCHLKLHIDITLHYIILMNVLSRLAALASAFRKFIVCVTRCALCFSILFDSFLANV